MKKKADINISLIDNIVDEFESFVAEVELYFAILEDASEYPEYAIPRSLKRAVKYLNCAGELLIKYRLQNEHWAFVFDNINAASKIAFDSGEVKSVYYEDAKNRLKNLCGIDVSFSTFEKLRKLRNGAEHYELHDQQIRTIKIIKGASAELLNFIDNFILISEEECEKTNWSASIEGIRTVGEKLEGKLNNLKRKK